MLLAPYSQSSSPKYFVGDLKLVDSRLKPCGNDMEKKILEAENEIQKVKRVGSNKRGRRSLAEQTPRAVMKNLRRRRICPGGQTFDFKISGGPRNKRRALR